MPLPDAIRLSMIDDSNLGDHSRLTEDDKCFFLFEYTSGRDYSFSRTNHLIANLKKKPTASGHPSYQYKGKAIRQCAADLGRALHPDWISSATFVPVPCSKARGHPEFDDRIEQICRGIRQPQPDVRCLVTQAESTTASHERRGGERITVSELLDLYRIDESLACPAPQVIFIVDDVLTAGTHYRAMHSVLSERFPCVPIFGLFIARRIFPDVVFPDQES